MNYVHSHQESIIIEFPKIEIWGPSLWFILHSLSMNSSSLRITNSNFYWNKLFMNLRHCIPCPQCKMHYNEYLTGNYKELYGILKNNNWIGLQEWLWKFHNNVRGRKGQPIIFTIDDFRSTYTGVSQVELLEHYRILEDQFRKGMHLRIYTRDQLASFTNILLDLIRSV